MKPLPTRQVESMLLDNGLFLVSSNSHKKYRCSITGLSVLISHDTKVSPGVLRTVLKQLKRIKELRGKHVQG